MAEDKDTERSKLRQAKKWGRPRPGSRVGTAHNRRAPESKGDGSYRRRQRAAQKADYEKKKKARAEAAAAVGRRGGGRGGRSVGTSAYDAAGGGTVGITGGQGTTGRPLDIGGLLANAVALREQREKARQRAAGRYYGAAPAMSNIPSLGAPQRTYGGVTGGGGGGGSGGGMARPPGQTGNRLEDLKYQMLLRGPMMKQVSPRFGLGAYTVRDDPMWEAVFGQGAGVSIGQGDPRSKAMMSAAEDVAGTEAPEPWTLGGGRSGGPALTDEQLLELLQGTARGGSARTRRAGYGLTY
jgi:hypothetical protein